MSLTKRHFDKIQQEDINQYIQEIHWSVSDEWGIWQEMDDDKG